MPALLPLALAALLVVAVFTLGRRLASRAEAAFRRLMEGIDDALSEPLPDFLDSED